MRVEIQTYSSPCAFWVFMESFSTRNSPIASSLKWEKIFFGGSFFVLECKQSKLQKQTFSIRAATNFPAEFSRSQTQQGDSNVQRLVNNFRDIDQPGNIWFDLNSSTWPWFTQWERSLESKTNQLYNNSSALNS